MRGYGPPVRVLSAGRSARRRSTPFEVVSWEEEFDTGTDWACFRPGTIESGVDEDRQVHS